MPGDIANPVGGLPADNRGIGIGWIGVTGFDAAQQRLQTRIEPQAGECHTSLRRYTLDFEAVLRPSKNRVDDGRLAGADDSGRLLERLRIHAF